MAARNLVTCCPGRPYKTPTETRWEIEFAKAQTYAGKTLLGREAGRFNNRRLRRKCVDRWRRSVGAPDERQQRCIYLYDLRYLKRR